MKQIFRDIPLMRNWIYEAIATTFNKNKKPNSAAIGIYAKNFRTIVIELYKTSKTYKNILREMEFAVNFTDNISLFYKSSISKRGLRYLKSKKINAPILREADGYLELRIIKIKDLDDKVRIESELVDPNQKVINFLIGHKNFALQNFSCSKINKKINLVNRAKSLALESIINATKIPYVSDSDKKFLNKEIKKYSRIIKKVAPDSEYERIAENINNKINK